MVRGGLEPSWNNDLALATLQPAPVFPELYQELWWYSGGSTGTTSSNVSGTFFVSKGGGLTSTKNSAIQLINFSSSWKAATQCAFEISLWASSASDIAYAALYDVTTVSSPTLVSGSQVSTSSTTATVLRSGQFTLTPGHSYGISIWNSSTSYTCQITDASFIVFPLSPQTSPSVNAISLANPSGNTLKESYIPLWVYSSGASLNVNSTSLGSYFLQKGNNSCLAIANPPQSQIKLCTLGSNWNANQKFALEASFYPSNGVATATVALWDMSSGGYGSLISASQISNNNQAATLMRSGSFALIPGRSYGVTVAISNTNYGTLVNKAHLVALA